MKNFYNLFEYKCRSLGTEEIFSQCKLLTRLGPLPAGMEVPYLVFNFETRKGFVCTGKDENLQEIHIKFSIQVGWNAN